MRQSAVVVVHIADFKPCTSYEMEEYPKRMRDWLYVVMKEMVGTASVAYY